MPAQTIHIVRKRSFKGKLLFCDRVAEGQAEGVERLPGDQTVIRIVEKIAGKRVTNGLHMDPDLMGPPGFQMKAYQRKSGCLIKRTLYRQSSRKNALYRDISVYDIRCNSSQLFLKFNSCRSDVHRQMRLAPPPFFGKTRKRQAATAKNIFRPTETEGKERRAQPIASRITCAI